LNGLGGSPLMVARDLLARGSGTGTAMISALV
jgi:hypothetical protein